MAYINFRIKTDYELSKKTMGQLGEKVIDNVKRMRIKANKPCITFIGGGSGEGKSWGVLRITEVTAIEEIERDPELFLQNQIIYTPFEYPRKFRWILFDKDAKRRKVLIFMESRELVKAKLWYTIINQSIADVNAMSRTVKPLDFTMISQEISDIDKELRRTINFYAWCLRPYGQHTKLYFYQVFNTKNIEGSKIIQKKLHGLVWTPTKRYNLEIDKFILNLPSKALRKRFVELDFRAKSEIILRKLDTMEKALRSEMPKITRIESLVEIALRDPGVLKFMLYRQKRTGRMKVKKEFASLYDISGRELGDFEKQLMKKLKEVGIMANDDAEKKEGDANTEKETINKLS